jgi:hypothetical protein
MKCALYRVDTGRPFVADAEIVPNADGSVSFRTPDGVWAGQEPNAYGVRHDQPATETPGVYQRATLQGQSACFVTRPQDAPQGYYCAQGQVY